MGHNVSVADRPSRPLPTRERFMLATLKKYYDEALLIGFAKDETDVILTPGHKTKMDKNRLIETLEKALVNIKRL